MFHVSVGEGLFFRWGEGFIFKWGEHPREALVLVGEVFEKSRKMGGGGGGGRPPHLPPRTMGIPAILVYPKTKITDNIFNHQNGTKTHQIFPANIYFL